MDWLNHSFFKETENPVLQKDWVFCLLFIMPTIQGEDRSVKPQLEVSNTSGGTRRVLLILGVIRSVVDLTEWFLLVRIQPHPQSEVDKVMVL